MSQAPLFGVAATAIGLLLFINNGSLLALLAYGLTAVFVYFGCIQHWTFFSSRGVPFVRGMPLLGTTWRMLCGRSSMSGTFTDLYNRFADVRFFGIYELFGRPVYVIRDPELAKQIFVRDFDHFVNHRISVSTDADPILGRTMFVVRDEKWRTTRSTISPVFTGSKMRLMLRLVADCAHNFTQQLRVEVAGRPRVYDTRDLFVRFACDTIATSAFGLEVNSLRDRDNEFLRMGMKAAQFGGLQGLKFLAFGSIPGIMRALRVSFFSGELIKFFRDQVMGVMQYREQNNVMRPDMINLLMEARKGKLFHGDEAAEVTAAERNIGFATVEESEVGKSTKVIQSEFAIGAKYKRILLIDVFILSEWEDDDLVAQSMIFILAGFNAISLSTAFMAHDLALHPDVQQRLYEEIIAVARDFSSDKPITYEALQSMKYLDMVVCESMRLWPIGGMQDRYVNKPYVLTQSDGTKVQLNVGDGLWVPMQNFQLDGAYFPDPQRFDPERFSDENRASIRAGTYLPFGSGPRNCIGSRFALMEMKALFVYLLLDFELHKCAKTMDPIEMKEGSGFIMEPRDGFWLEFRPRNRV